MPGPRIRKLNTLLLFISSTFICVATFAKESTLLSQSLALWQNVYDDGEAKLINDEIHLIAKHNWFLLSKEQFSDFELEAEVLLPEVEEYTNSGLIFRAQIGQNDQSGRFAFGYQADVDPSERKWSGGLYDQGTGRMWLHPIHPKRSKPDEHFKQNLSSEWDDTKANAYKPNQWNHVKVRALGSELKIWVNGTLTTHVIDTKAAKGYVGIQHHGSKMYSETGDKQNTVRFRNIIIRPL